MAKTDITLSRLKEYLEYNPATGHLTKRVGYVHPSGHRYVMVDNEVYSEHRLVWFYNHGKWPEHDIDHINGDPSDNRIENLRDVPAAINMQNERKPRKNNTSGFLGVHFKKKLQKYGAGITVRRKRVHLGYFDTPQEAYAAYVTAKRKLHEGCTI